MGEVVELRPLVKATSKALTVPSSAYMSRTVIPNPPEMITMAADQHMIDRILEWGEARMRATHREPLTPNDRRIAMKMIDAFDPTFSPKKGPGA